MLTNAVIHEILSRRSVRSYQPELISEEEMESLITAAQYAPSAMGRQDRHFTVVTNAELLDEIQKATGRESFYNAPAAVIVSVPPQNEHGMEDAACAIMNLMAAAYSMGISTCYIASATGTKDPQIMRKLQIPEGYLPAASVIIGYAKEAPDEPAPRRADSVTWIK